MCYKRLNRAQKDAEHQIFDTTKKQPRTSLLGTNLDGQIIIKLYL